MSIDILQRGRETIAERFVVATNFKERGYFHDTYNSANKFMHRGWTEGSIKVHQWWNGVKQYGQHFFQNR